MVSKFLTPKAPLAAVAMLALAGCMSSLPPVDPHLAPITDRVVSRASGSLGEEIGPGMVLTKVFATGNTVFFETRAANIAALELGSAPSGGMSLQKRFERVMGARFCAPGHGVRKFVDMGGAVQIIVKDKSGAQMVGARLTGC